MGHIYKIEFPNGKNYIGQTTTSIEQRKREHKSSAKKSKTTILLYNALRKYDMIETFELIQIDSADTMEELSEKEMKYILEYNSFYRHGKGYNMTYGGEGCNGYVFTEEDRQKISEAQTKRFDDPKEREKSSEAGIKRFQDDEERLRHGKRMKQRMIDNPALSEKFSESQKKRFDDPKEREKSSEAGIKRFKDNPEAGQKHSETMKQHYVDNPGAKEKLKLMQEQHWGIEENRQKQSERTTKYHEENPDAGKKHSEFMRKRFEDRPEIRTEMSKRTKQLYEDPKHKIKILDSKGQNKPFDIFKNGEFINTFTYQFQATEFLQIEYNITPNKISEVLNGKRKSSNGFEFKYK
jgi:hypothetical protein